MSGISDTSSNDLLDETSGPHVIETWEEVSESKHADGYIVFLMGYARYLFRGF